MNSLVDPHAIRAMYAAAQAGVRIDLIVRGICCLRPGVPGVSDNIRVMSLVDKFLEHSRIAYFQNADQPEVYLTSADWMPRNFRRRVEVMFPVEDARLRTRLIDGILGVYLSDNVKARYMRPDGTYVRVRSAKAGEPVVRAQLEFLKMARDISAGDDALRPATPGPQTLVFGRPYPN